MIIANSPKKLCEKLQLAKRQLKNAKTREEMLAISNYIGGLNEAIQSVSDGYDKGDNASFLNNKSNEILDKKYFTHEDKMMKNFLENKEFHRAFFERIYKKTDHEKKKIKIEENISITTLSEEDYYNIFFDFMNQIGLSKYFDRFVKNNRIYNSNEGIQDTTLGYTIFNPITKDSDIFVNELDFDIFSMFTLAHEFGHVYDLNHFEDNINNWNIYFYQSFNGETIPKIFERLFVDFLIKNNIQLPETKLLLDDMIHANYEFALTSYIITLIPDTYLLDDSYLYLSPTKIYKLVERHFSRKNHIRKFINKCSDFEVKGVYPYSYGDVLSMILKDEIINNNYDLSTLDNFFQLRGKTFEIETLNKLNVTPDRYVKLYKKDIELLKK